MNAQQARERLAEALHDAGISVAGLWTAEQTDEQRIEAVRQRLSPAVSFRTRQVYRVVKANGEPESGRLWSNKGHATLSLRHSWDGDRVEKGTVIWHGEDE